MGLLSKIGSWVSTNLPIVTKVVKKAAEVVHKAASVVESLLEGRDILNDDDKNKAPHDRKGGNTKRPDVMGGDSSWEQSTYLNDLNKSINENKQKLMAVQDKNEIEHRRIQIQIDIMELVVSASTFERFTNNINLHAANLQIHLQTIQNTAGLLDSVNRQRVAIKALMKTVNHMINVLNVNNKVEPIAGIDIDIRQGSISIHKAYEAFENTRQLLIDEIESFSFAIQDQLGRVENVRSSARGIPDVGRKVSAWLSDSVEPKLIDAQKFANSLKGELLVVPALEAGLRRDLNDVQQDGL